ncbi:unnamed protein product [Ilex paraguariensis]|uniref:Uncharacterized protein n=1 Tax=Ilex paraguariensis TaxID=185542 RepID=A0ABC8RNA8_9AQUA
MEPTAAELKAKLSQMKKIKSSSKSGGKRKSEPSSGNGSIPPAKVLRTGMSHTSSSPAVLDLPSQGVSLFAPSVAALGQASPSASKVDRALEETTRILTFLDPPSASFSRPLSESFKALKKEHLKVEKSEGSFLDSLDLATGAFSSILPNSDVKKALLISLEDSIALFIMDKLQ